jgi:endonuclease G
LELDEFRVFQVPVTEIEQRTKLRFPQAVRDADTLTAPEELGSREPLTNTDEIRW